MTSELKTPVTIKRVWLKKPTKRRVNPQLEYRLSNGESKYVTLVCSLPAAQDIIKEKRDQIAKGNNRPESHIPGYGRYRETLLQFCERHLSAFYERIGSPIAPVSHSNYKNREQSLKKLYRVLGDVEVAEITAKHITLFKTALSKTHARNSINTYIAHGSAAWQTLIAEDANTITTNPFSGQKIPGPSGKDAGARYFTDDQQRIIDIHLVNWGINWHHFAAMFALLTGARVGGVLNANRNNMYLDKNEWMIEIKEKGSKTRDVPIPHTLKIMIDNRIALAQSPNLPQQINEIIFPGDDPAPYLTRAAQGFLIWEVMSENNGQSVTRMFGRHLKRLKITGSFHWLRHSFAKNYLDNGGDMETLSQLLGHADIRTTYKHYGHITNRRKKAGINEKVYIPVEIKITGE